MGAGVAHTTRRQPQHGDTVTDFRLMRGEDWVRCCICGALHESPWLNLATDEDGDLTDVCTGCAREAGIPSATGHGTVAALAADDPRHGTRNARRTVGNQVSP